MSIELIVEWGIPRDLPTAKRQAEAAAEIGAAWSKWQLLKPEQLASTDATRYWAAELGGDESQLETFRRAGGIGDEDWLALANHCRSCGVRLLATPFDLDAVALLEGIGVAAYKIASGDITYRALFKRIEQTGKRIFFSCGAATPGEIRAARSWLKLAAPTALACDLIYPCASHLARFMSQLRMLQTEGITSIVGLSDHTREVVTGAVAVAAGARVLEKHVTLDPNGGAPDDRMALTVGQASEYLRLANQAAELCAGAGEKVQDKARIEARRSAYAARHLGAGKILESSDIAWLRPAPENSITPNRKLRGRMLARSVKKGEPITWDALA